MIFANYKNIIFEMYNNNYAFINRTVLQNNLKGILFVQLFMVVCYSRIQYL